ncbi:hypothetical protein A2U01_0093308 [Trifolium medium]|uniref:Uncharacterized protein n=1 Tax=Trifolium medium TaxID=97028 RepID=A0A392UJX0_9FABA|nr:hypothetical protein [Trifolium medium]
MPSRGSKKRCTAVRVGGVWSTEEFGRRRSLVDGGVCSKRS